MSFGSTFGGGGGFGTNNNQQQSTNAFGGFGPTNNNSTTTGFGASNNTLFGNNNNSNNTNTGGGLFGGGAANNSSAFGSGGFGTGNNNNQSTGFGARSTFGSSSPATGGGLFGSNNNSNNSTTATGTGFGGFGSTANNTSSAFGSTSTGGLFGPSNTNAFGANNNSTSSPFGASTNSNTGFGSTPNTNTAFGASGTTAFGQNNNQQQTQQNQSNQQNNGTGGTAFNAHVESEGSGTTAVKTYFQSITCQPPYQNFSFEELRSVDYNQGRKFANQSGQPGSFGASTGFGGSSTFGNTPNSTGFGATNTGSTGLFGQSQQNTSSPFGQTPSNTSAFGANNQSSGGLFGQNKPATGGLFGSTPASSGTTGGGLFGTSGTTNAAGFGSGGAGFGTSNTTSGLFGQNQQKPAFGTGTGTPGFGATGTTTFGQSNTSTGNVFGQNQTGGTGFGAQQTNTSTPFGSSLFGQNNQNQTQNASSFGNNNTAFGQNQTQKPSLFGQSNTTTNTGSLFGQNNNQQQSGGLFGQNNNQQQQPSGGLFGAKPATNTTSLFGQPANSATPSLFGSTNNQQQQSGSLFGQPQNQQQKPSLFGATSNNANSGGNNLFGGMNQNNQQTTPSLFGNTQQQQQPQMGSSLFGSVQQQQQPLQQSQPPQTLTTSIMSATPYGNDQLFASLDSTPKNIGPLATPLSSSQKQRRPMPLPQYKINSAASSRLVTPQRRSGYGFSYSTYGTPGSAVSAVSPTYTGLLGASMGRSLSKSLSANNLRSSFNSQESILNPNAFSPGGLRPNGGTGSLRKLRIDRSLRTDLFGTADSTVNTTKSTPLKKSVTFESGKESNATGGADNALVLAVDNSTPSAEEQGLLRTSRHSTNGNLVADNTTSASAESIGNELTIVPENSAPLIPSTKSIVSTSKTETARMTQEDDVPGEYYMIPSKAQIEKMSRAERSSVKGFTVGREGIGKIEFSDVDLTNIDLDRICGKIVFLLPRSATVYIEQSEKPPQGKGLNVPSTITLANSWPRAKGGTLPVYERKGPRFEKHIERLKRVRDTEFVDYNIETGEWTFRVQHFSTYELEYEDDAASVADVSMTNNTPNASRSTNQSVSESHVSHDFSSSNLANRSSDMIDLRGPRNRRVLPGAFDQSFISDDEDTSAAEDDMEMTERDHEGEGTTEDDEEVDEVSQRANFDDDDVFGSDSQMDRSFPMERVDGINEGEDLLTGSVRKPKSILKGSLLANSNFGTPIRAQRLVGGDWADQLQRTLSPKKQDRQALRRSQGTVLREKTTLYPLGASKFTKDKTPFATSLDVMNSLFGQDSALPMNGSTPIRDASRANLKFKNASLTINQDFENSEPFSNSIRPSWIKDGAVPPILAKSKAQMSKFVDALTTNKSSYSRSEQNLAAAPFDVNAQSALETQRSMTDVVLENDIPRAQLQKGKHVFHALEEAVNDSSMIGLSHHEKLIWGLLSRLWESGMKDVKSELTYFWKDMVSAKVEEQLKSVDTPEDKAVVNLSGLNVWNATQNLLDGKNYRLAGMVAQIGGDKTMRDGMANQLRDWHESDTISEISLAIRTLYELLAGNTCISEGKNGPGSENKTETFCISRKYGFDWRRAFGLRLFYGIVQEESISDAVRTYSMDLSSGKESVRPKPWFVEDDMPTAWNDEDIDQREDVLWGLLKLHTSWTQGSEEHTSKREIDLRDIVSPFNITGNPLQGRLSFQLFHLLSAVREGQEETEDKGDLYTKDYLSELGQDSSNLCNAVFVALFLSNPEDRRTSIQHLLIQHARVIGDSSSSCPIFSTLTQELKVPSTLIWLAKAAYFKNIVKDSISEMRCLLNARQLTQAHDVFISTVGPQTIIEEDMDALEKYLSLFRQQADTGPTSIKGWDRGGEVYETYARLINPSGPLSVGEKERLIRKLNAFLPPIVARSASLGLMERVAITEMISHMRQQITELQSRVGESKDLSSLKLPEMPSADDKVLKEAISLTESYYASLLA